MAKKLNEIHYERGKLRERIASQRRDLSRAARPVETLLKRTDTAIGYARQAADFVLAHLETFAVLGVIIAIRKPNFSLRWARRGFFAWKLWQRFGRLDIISMLLGTDSSK